LDIEKSVLGEKHPSYAATLGNLGSLYQNHARFKEAEEFFNNALDIEKNVLGEKHPSYATTLANLGSLYQIKPDSKKQKNFSIMPWILKKMF